MFHHHTRTYSSSHKTTTNNFNSRAQRILQVINQNSYALPIPKTPWGVTELDLISTITVIKAKMRTNLKNRYHLTV